MNPLSFTLWTLIRLYQLFISPILPGVCRHLPTCSEYALESVRSHGTLVGTWLALKRIGRCQPWGTSGHDPVRHAGSAHGGTPQGNRELGA